MELTAQAISVQGAHAPMLRPTSLHVGDHQVLLLAGDPGAGHTAVSLALSGRLRPDGGEVKLDGSADEATLRRLVAVVDTPGITEPDDPLPVRTVVGEELAVAGRKAGRRAVQDWLAGHDAAEYGELRFEQLPVKARTRLLVELTVERPEVKVLVLTMPDRFGGEPHDWYAIGRELASRGYGVVITCSETSARLLDVPAARLGSLDPPEPVHVAAAAPVEPIAPTDETAPAEAVDEPAATEPVVPVDEAGASTAAAQTVDEEAKDQA